MSPCYPTPQTLSLCLQTGILRLERHLSTVVATNLLLAPPPPEIAKNGNVLECRIQQPEQHGTLLSMTPWKQAVAHNHFIHDLSVLGVAYRSVYNSMCENLLTYFNAVQYCCNCCVLSLPFTMSLPPVIFSLSSLYSWFLLCT